jgi:DNA polymerase-1
VTLDIEVIEDILRWKELAKLKGTYIDNLRDMVDYRNRIHCKYNQDVARTGRLSSSEPNLQNIPTLENDKFGIRLTDILTPSERVRRLNRT